MKIEEADQYAVVDSLWVLSRYGFNADHLGFFKTFNFKTVFYKIQKLRY